MDYDASSFIDDLMRLEDEVNFGNVTSVDWAIDYCVASLSRCITHRQVFNIKYMQWRLIGKRDLLDA